MKKILLGTTVLGAAALFAGAASADTPKITLGGVADFQVGLVSEDDDADERAGAFRSDTEISVAIDGKTAGGTGYGGLIILEADLEDDVDGEGSNAARTLLYVEGDNWGRVEGGSTYGVASALKVDASRIARATGGIDGDWTYFGVATGGETYLATPDLVTDFGGLGAGLGDEGDQTINKINYYTPRWSGFQAGVSYYFDTTGGDRGQVLSRSDATDGEAENVFELALNYEGKFEQVSIAAAATGQFGSGETSATEDLQAWNAGLQLGYMGWSAAVSYGDWGDSLQVSTDFDDRDYWTAGIAYETGPYGVSVTFLDSNYEVGASDDNEFTNLSIGADYKFAPGFTPYVEVNFLDLDDGDESADNDATVFIAGTQLAF